MTLQQYWSHFGCVRREEEGDISPYEPAFARVTQLLSQS